MSDRASVLVEGSVAYYRASAAGNCARALSGQRMGMDPIPPTVDMQRRFADGHLHEAPILEAVERELNQAVVRQQEEWTVEISPRVVVVGHVDGVTDGDLSPVEAKSASHDSYADWDHSIERWFKKRPYYADQWTLTLHAYNKQSGYYAVKNKNNGRVLIREVGPQTPMADIKVRLLRIDLDGRRGILPSCDRKQDYFCPMRYLHDPEEKRTVEQGDEVLEELGRAYLEAKEAVDRSEKVRKELQRRIAEAMGDRERVKCSMFSIAMVNQVRRTLDKQKLSEVYGDLTPFEVVTTSVYPRVSQKREEDA